MYYQTDNAHPDSSYWCYSDNYYYPQEESPTPSYNTSYEHAPDYYIPYVQPDIVHWQHSYQYDEQPSPSVVPETPEQSTHDEHERFVPISDVSPENPVIASSTKLIPIRRLDFREVQFAKRRQPSDGTSPQYIAQVKEYIIANGLNQKMLASRMKFSEATISAYMRGAKRNRGWGDFEQRLYIRFGIGAPSL